MIHAGPCAAPPFVHKLHGHRALRRPPAGQPALPLCTLLLMALLLMALPVALPAADGPLPLTPAPAPSSAAGFAPVLPGRQVQLTAEAAWIGDPAAGRVRLTVHGRVAPGYYIYGLAGEDADMSAATRLEVEGAAPGPLTESPTSTIQDAVFDGPRRVHRGSFRITQELTLTARRQADAVLHGALIYHVCDGRICSDERRLAFAVAVAGD